VVVISLLLREEKRERESVCVYVCGCERGQDVGMQSMLGPCGSNGTVASL
jgi:hypothetical protein